jgi:hypothetical protein
LRLIMFKGGHYRAPQHNEDYGTGETPPQMLPDSPEL